MTGAVGGQRLVTLLARISAGSVEVTLGGTPLARLDGGERTLTVELDPILRTEFAPGRVRRAGRLSLWSARGIPAALARAGWRVSLRSESRELIGLGRGTSPLSGHMHVSPTALWKLRRLV